MKIIILTGKFGMGHFSAAQNIKTMLDSAIPGQRIIIGDLYEIAFPQRHNLIYSVYGNLVKKGGKLVGMAYSNAIGENGDLPLALDIPQRYLLDKLSEYLDRQSPDLIISTYSLAARLVSLYIKNRRLTTPLITCITDVGVHNVWLNSNTSLYLTACRETADSLFEKGVSADKITLCGMPLKKEFYRKSPMHGLSRNRELLIMGGGLGMLPGHKSFYAGIDRLANVHTTVICGNNRKLEQKLRNWNFSHITVLGKCNSVPEYMYNADLFLTKPGGISTFEAAAANLPMLLFSPSMEQEKHNLDFILSNNFGQVLSATEDIPAQINSMINNQKLLRQISSNMRDFENSLDHFALINYVRQMKDILETERSVS